MKNSFLWGYTTAEKLNKLEAAYDALMESLLANANPRGNYSAGAIYEYGDIVSYNGSSYLYMYKTPAQNIPVTDWEHWLLVAEKGEPGANGANGTDGVGIEKVENFGAPSVGDSFTVTQIEQSLTNGEKEYFDVYAQNGANGTNGTNGTNGIDALTVNAYVVISDIPVNGMFITLPVSYFNRAPKPNELYYAIIKGGDNNVYATYVKVSTVGSSVDGYINQPPLKINGDKGESGGATLYAHNVSIKQVEGDSQQSFTNLIIINQSASGFSYYNLRNYLSTNGFTSVNSCLPASGFVAISPSDIIGIYYDIVSADINIIFGGDEHMALVYNPTGLLITDKIITIS